MISSIDENYYQNIMILYYVCGIVDVMLYVIIIKHIYLAYLYFILMFFINNLQILSFFGWRGEGGLNIIFDTV